MTGDVTELGYDPRPEVERWQGTPIPPVRDPLCATPERVAIAERVWWHGPAWTVLRNASHFLWHVWDWGTDDDIAFTRTDVAERLWLRALEDARPGLVSAGSYVFLSYAFGRMSGEEVCDWPRNAHRLDVKPLAGETRERMYERAAAWRAGRTAPLS